MIRGQIASDYVQLRDPRKINSLNVLKMNLCSLAHPADGGVFPEMCRKCEVKCGYGKRLLILWENPENRPKKRGRKPKGA